MMNNDKAMRTLVFSLAGLLALGLTTWLVFYLIHDDQDQIAHSQEIDDDQTPLILSINDGSSLTQDVSPANSQLESITSEDSGFCSARCDSTLSLLDDDLELDDDTFNRLKVNAEEIAVYLQSNEHKRLHYLEMALTTNDGDKRAFLTYIFKQLPYQYKAEIGALFVNSENWRVRADGVTLIADHDASNADVTNTLLEIFANEENSYVKSSILAFLKQTSALKGDTEIMHQLDSGVYNDADPSVRAEALKAKMQLSEQGYQILPDALQALRASESELKFAGLIAIEKILEHEQTYRESGVYIDKQTIKNEIQLIRNLSAYGDQKKGFERLVQEANAVYLRHFEY